MRIIVDEGCTYSTHPFDFRILTERRIGSIPHTSQQCVGLCLQCMTFLRQYVTQRCIIDIGKIVVEPYQNGIEPGMHEA